jgi:hypothetical protein
LVLVASLLWLAVVVCQATIAQTINVAPRSTIKLWPHPDPWWTPTPSLLTDGTLYIPQTFYGMLGKLPARYEFRLDRAYTIQQVRFHQGVRNDAPERRENYASAYRIRGDADGDYVYELTLAEARHELNAARSADNWMAHSFEPVRIRGIQLEALEGHGGVYPSISEFEINAIDAEPWSPPDAPTTTARIMRFVHDMALQNQCSAMPDPPFSQQLRRGMFVIPYDYLAQEDNELTQQPLFKQMMQNLERMHLDHLWI